MFFRYRSLLPAVPRNQLGAHRTLWSLADVSRTASALRQITARASPRCAVKMVLQPDFAVYDGPRALARFSQEKQTKNNQPLLPDTTIAAPSRHQINSIGMDKESIVEIHPPQLASRSMLCLGLSR